MAPQWHTFDHADALAQRLADHVANLLSTAINRQARATLAVSGGRTPIPFFAALSNQPLSWDKVWVTLVDERMVSTEHSDSNANLVHRYLLQGRAAAAHFIPLVKYGSDPQSELNVAEQRLTQLAWPLDIVILGMGEDGHTASLFPDAIELQRGLTAPAYQRCLMVQPPPTASHARISFTAPALLDCRQLIIHLTGASKHQLLLKACEPGSINALPIRLALHQTQVPCHVFWSP